MTIYLMVKTHRKTGLKYLCKTSRNPFKYRGSGEDWIPHLKEHGKDHATEIIKECSSQEEFSYWGRYYSRLWNIVGAMDNFGNKIWANRIPETGGGALYGDLNPSKRLEVKKKKKDNTLVPGYVYPMTLPVNRAKISGANHQSQKDPSYIEKFSGDNHYTRQLGFISPIKGEGNPSKNPVSRKKMEKTWLEKYGVDNPMNSDIVKAKVSGEKHYSHQEGWESPIKGENHYTAKEGYVSVRAGDKHYTKKPDYKVKPTNKNYDHNIYTWENIETGELVKLNRRDMIEKYNLNPVCVCGLVNGTRRIHKNWIID